MGIHFDDNAWHQYVDWQHLDRKTLKKNNAQIGRASGRERV